MASTAASFLTEIEKLRSFQMSRIKRRVNAFYYVSTLPFGPQASAVGMPTAKLAIFCRIAKHSESFLFFFDEITSKKEKITLSEVLQYLQFCGFGGGRIVLGTVICGLYV